VDDLGDGFVDVDGREYSLPSPSRAAISSRVIEAMMHGSPDRRYGARL
jgi:hypothetical protein